VTGRGTTARGTTGKGATKGSDRVAFAGERGSFAEDAAQAYFGSTGSVGLASFRDVFEAVQRGEAAAGVLPIENLVNGTVREVYDLLLEHQLVITGEVIVPVRLCLAALPRQGIDDIERVYSHIQALGQAERFLRTRPWSLLTTYNTAGAGKLIADGREKGAAAVLSPRAAALFGLKPLATDIQDVPDNRSRFLVLRRPFALDAVAKGLPPPGPGLLSPGQLLGPDAPSLSDRPMRTTLVLAVRNEPGTLNRALAVFAEGGLNMSKLESRPSRDQPWEYVFWVDLDADVRSAATRAALAELIGVAAMVRVLGCYPRGEEPGAPS
jgi:prephenate dehydratase